MWSVKESVWLGKGGFGVILGVEGVEEGKEGVEKGEDGAWRKTNGVEWWNGWSEEEGEEKYHQ